MKRITLILAAFALLAISCTKSDYSSFRTESNINFMPVSALSTKVDGVVFPTDDTFNAYAWTEGTTGEYFMDDEIVGYNEEDDTWKTETTYYWPGQPVDFFCYYPSYLSGMTISQNRITLTNDYASSQQDIMYADKAVGFTENTTNYGYTGVPTVFHHAGAKLAVYAYLADDTTEDEMGNATRWEINLKSVRLSGIYTTGTCTLNLSSSATGVIPWTKPTDAAGNAVWSHGAPVNSDSDTKFNYTDAVIMEADSVYKVLPEFYILPQTLVEGQQQVTIEYDLKTYRTPLNGEEQLFLSQENRSVTVNLLSDLITAWPMNHAVTYTLLFNPVNSSTPIYFAPTVADWVNIQNTTTIDLGL